MIQQEIDELERELSQRDKTMQNCELVKLRVKCDCLNKEEFNLNLLDTIIE